MKIAIIGHGNVGGALADRLQRLGHDVTVATNHRESDSLARLLAKNADVRVAAPDEAAGSADVVVLATPFRVAGDVLEPLAASLVGKILIDCTNPVGPGVTHGLGDGRSGTEAIQALVPGAHVVKAFNTYGYENLEDSRYPDYNVRPVMMLCGADRDAKRVVALLAEQLGWRPLDVGGIEQALHLEHMTLLWVRMVRVDGHSPHMVWAMLER